MFPHFLCIGAQKAGTTWLHTNLSKHKDLWLPPIKEIHYFDYKEKDFSPAFKEQLFNNQPRNRRWRRIAKNRLKLNLKSPNFQRLSWDINYLFNRQNNDNWYSSLFELGRGKIIGEITPAYSTLNPSSVAHIYELMPTIKIIFIMRNPIERAWSYFFSYMSKQGKTIDSFSEIELKNQFNSNYSLLRGSYSQTLQVWQTYSFQEQFFIGFFEEIIEHPEEFLASICNFLGVKASKNYLNNIDKNKINSYENKNIIPEQIAKDLAKIYYDEIYYLNKHYGG
jgi:hypothetical protein